MSTSSEADGLAVELGRAVRGEVSVSGLRRAEYATDASNYRVLPQVVVYPRDVDDLLAVTAVSRERGVPLTLRGGGTSVAGNAVGTGIVVDTSVHLNRVLALDPAAATARVQPGTVLGTLQAAAAKHGLRFGPDPSTSSRATLGGMIGNNACGPHAVAFGRTAENVLELDVVDGRGRRFVAARDPGVVPGLPELVAAQPGRPAHRAGHLRPPGQRVLAGAPAARARRRPGPGAGRHRGHGGHRAGGHRRAGAAGPGAGAGGAGLPGHAERGRRRHRAARAPAAGHGGDGRPAGRRRPPARARHRRARAAGRRRLAVRRGRRGRRRTRRCGPPARWPRTPAPARCASCRPVRRPRRCGGCAPTAPVWPGAPRPAGRPGRAGRTPRCRRPRWAPTCASSTS